MSNLFKKGFASLALASAMASSVFAGDAAYIDVKVNYLSGMGKAVLGYKDTNPVTNKRLEEVELLVSILDKDGNYATKNANGSGKVPEVKLDGVAFGAFNRSGGSETKAEDVGVVENTAIDADGVITRALSSKNSIHRFVIDYSDAEVSKLMDEVTLTSGSGSGKIERKVHIDLTTREARGLIVRATPNSSFKTERYINETFSGIEIIGEVSGYALSTESVTSPGGIAGVVVPLQVYASTVKFKNASTGRFTFASNLEGKTIVVQALADYSNNGTPSVALNSVELKMINGQATGEITITNAMPAAAFGTAVTPTNGEYGTTTTDGGGLGVVLIAYVKEKQSINSYIDTPHQIRDNTVLDSYDFNVTMADLGDSSDTIQVRSGEATALKVGTFAPTATKLSKLWTKTSEIFNIAEGADLTAGTVAKQDGTITNVTGVTGNTKTITVIDSYGNPAVGDAQTNVVVKIDDEAANKNTKLVTSVSGSITGASTTATNGVTMVTILASDSEDTNSTLSIKSQKLTIDASDGVLHNVKAKDLTIRTLPLIEVTKNGGPNWIDSIADVTTIDAFSLATHAVLSTGTADVVRADANDFTVVIKSGVDDPKLEDNNVTFRLYIKDKSGEGEFLEGNDLKNYSFKVSSSSGANFTTTGLFYNEKGTDMSAGSIDGKDNAKDGYWRFDYQAADASDDFTIQIGSSDSSSAQTKNVADLVSIIVENFNAAAVQEEEIIINIPANEDKYTNAYVNVYMDNVDELTEIPVGSVVNFKFTGSAVSTGDVVTIDMNSTGLGYMPNGKKNDEGRIGVVGSDVSSNKNGEITTTLPENHIVSIVLYDANKSDEGIYGFDTTTNAVTINGRKPVWLNLQDDEDNTAKMFEIGISDSIITKRQKKDVISKIRVVLPSTPVDHGDGSEEDKAEAFGSDVDFMYDGMFNGADNLVKTGLFYSLFNTEDDVILLDKYNNEIEGLKEDIGKDVTYTTTDGMEFKNNGADNSWIKFKTEAAGTEQTLTLTRTKDDGEKVTKTITWTNIKLSALNNKFMITTDSSGPIDRNTGAFDVINSEIVVKIIGDGHSKQSSTTVKVTHSDKTATVRFVKINGLKTKNLYTNALVGSTSSTGDVVQVKGNYYILSSDKVGDVTITATAKGKDSKGVDITVAGTHTVTFDAIDLDKPVINTDDVKVSNGEVTVVVQDVNLDTAKTTVVVKNKDGKKITDGVYANGKYTAKVSSAGTYLIDVIAIDMAGNVQLDADGKPQPFEFIRISGSGAPTLEEEAAAMLVSKKEYTVAGTFTSHDFGADKAKNWIYTKKSDGKSFQLLGETPSDKDIFGWKETKAKASTSNVWYMIKTGEGKFDWALANADGVAYKLKGAKSDNTFDFSGRLNLNVSHKDGMLTFTAK